MLPKQVVLVALLVASACAQYGVAGMYENLPLESTTPEASGDGSGNDNGYASGADAVAIDTDCSTKEDGLYAIGGCSPQFLTCSGGISRIMDCPANLIYDQRIVACEYSDNVPECGGTPQEVTTTEAYATQETTEASTIPAETTTVYIPIVPAVTTAAPIVEPVTRTAIDRTCQGKPDGFYSFGQCSDHYIACSNGYTIPMQCPARLAFDEARVICDYVLNVPECQNGSGDDQDSGSGDEETTTEEASGELPYSNGYGYEETTTAAVEETTESTDGYDVERSAAAYNAPYESTTAADVPSTTVEVTTEQVYETTTPEETTTEQYYETSTTEEVYETTTVPEEVTTEQVYETTTPEEVTTEQVYETTTPEEVTTEQAYETTSESVPSCIEGATAIEPCSQHYRNCVNGQETIFICESGLFFSPELARCTTTDQIAECHQKPVYY
ncbi:hypothetical protein GCK72_002899 [Caenorhabditis remanei]|uniref:Chitin-binding type-2 domain-containing protein n=1 Tax=Caenorhabditis remanei TaxID=31234 RepID=A0A6A5HWA7_CAERE|nr:hypothetical protein GCK72_002899 [Caenorhabditis remanei]KAF1771074.1 hypothetical protein GCK72_002899 [Caenorhabditis remanei]